VDGVRPLLEPYVTLLATEQNMPHWILGAVEGSLLLASFFVLGGEFWDKVKALFTYEARAILPADRTSVCQPKRAHVP
jgi:hypothetical protein